MPEHPLRSLPGFSARYYLREEPSGRLISLTAWETEALLEAAEEAVRCARPTASS